MARFEFRLPDIGEGVTEGEIVAWHVEAGQLIREDDPMVEVMTDKATVTIAAPRSGRVAERRGLPGETVAVHAILVVLELDEEGVRDERVPTNGGALAANRSETNHAGDNGAPGGGPEPAATAVGDLREDLPGMALALGRGAPSPGAARAPFFAEKPLATPATRKLARDLGLDLRVVPPTGRGGRVTSDDVREALTRTALDRSAGASIVERDPAEGRGGAGEPPGRARESRGFGNAARARPAAREERAPLRGLRRRIFENMARSKRTAAHFTFVEECDVTALKELRLRLKEPARAAGVELSFLPFIVKASVAALRRHPALNATFDEATQEIVTKAHYDIGIATATDAGLVVPVIKDAGDRSLLDLAREVARLAEGARNQRLKLDDLSGSTFTITSLGQKGGLFATPIIHFPEVAILGVHQIKRRPVVREDRIVIGDVMLLSLSFDHRLIDGHVGAAFAYDLIGLLERPEALFLDLV